MEKCFIAHLHVINCLNLSLIEPFDALAVLPETKLDFVVSRDDVSTQTMLLALVPISFVAPRISPRVDTKAMLFVIFVLAAVLTAVIPNVDSHAFHIIVKPLTLILSPIKPRINADTADFIFTPVASVH